MVPPHKELKSSSQEPFDPHVEIEAELRRMFDRALPVGLILAAIAVGASAVRASRNGWEGLFSLHAALVAGGIAVYLARNRLPFRTLVGVLLALAAVDGTANMMTYGLAHNGLLVLACVTVLAALAFGRRGALGALTASVAMWTTAAVLVTTGSREVTAALQVQLFSPLSWMSQIAAAILFVTVVVMATYGTQQRLVRSLRDEQQRRRELEAANKTLSEEIAQRERAERELAEREQTFRMLAENMDDMLFVQDMNMAPVYVSPAGEQLFGYSHDELMTMQLGTIMTPESLEQAMGRFAHYLPLAMQSPEAEVNVPLMEYEYVRKDGSKFWGELRVTFLRDADGRIKGSQGILRDITKRKQAGDEKVRLETQLRQSEKMRAIGQLAGGIAHDFNNQLTGITMGAGLIERELPEDSELHRYVKFVQTCSKRSADLTLKLLAFARASSTVPAPTDVHGVIREVVSMLEHSVDKTITVKASLKAEHHTVHADAAQLQSALLNIAVNARDAMPSGGRLEFHTDVTHIAEARSTASGLELAPGSYLQVIVRDTGHGMDEVTIKRIFEPFFTTKPQGQGTGLGLSTAYGTIKGLKGALDVDSERGVGTKFTMWVPFPPEGSHPPANQGTEQLFVHGTGRLLLVEDEETVRLAIAEMLEMLGYQVDACEDGEEALRIHGERATEFDAVILDIVLPKMGGKEVFLAMRARQPDAKILVVSGYAPEGEIGELVEHHGARFIQKPFSAGELSTALGALLRA